LSEFAQVGFFPIRERTGLGLVALPMEFRIAAARRFKMTQVGTQM